VIDNNSGDGTAEMVATQFPEVALRVLPENLGCATGFYEGISDAVKASPDWLWLLDDDTIPAPDALEELLTAWERFPVNERPSLLASRVYWTDGSLCKMNMPFVASAPVERVFLAAAHQSVAIRATSFVSMLVHRKLVERNGLPVKEYFIWGDDIEFSARMIRDDFGVSVPSSTVVHKTKANSGPTLSSGARYYFKVRNDFWSLRFSNAWTARERRRLWMNYAWSLTQDLAKSLAAPRMLITLISAAMVGLAIPPESSRGKFLQRAG
jgi:GT2 family glycosyltransferase